MDALKRFRVTVFYSAPPGPGTRRWRRLGLLEEMWSFCVDARDGSEAAAAAQAAFRRRFGPSPEHAGYRFHNVEVSHLAAMVPPARQKPFEGAVLVLRQEGGINDGHTRDLSGSEVFGSGDLATWLEPLLAAQDSIAIVANGEVVIRAVGGDEMTRAVAGESFSLGGIRFVVSSRPATAADVVEPIAVSGAQMNASEDDAPQWVAVPEPPLPRRRAPRRRWLPPAFWPEVARRADVVTLWSVRALFLLGPIYLFFGDDIRQALEVRRALRESPCVAIDAVQDRIAERSLGLRQLRALHVLEWA